MSQQNVSAKYLLKMSHQNVLSKCIDKMSHESVKSKCQIKIILQIVLLNISSICLNNKSHLYIS